MYTKSKYIWYAEDSVLILIDFQEEVMDFIHDKDRKLVELNAITVAKMAVKLDIPVILSTVAVKMGVGTPTIAALKEALPGIEEIDRTSMDAWEDETLVNAVKATGKKKLVMAGIVTSTCLTFGALHALSEGYDVMFIEDAVGDKSKEEHENAVRRLIQAGAVPTSSIALTAEWFRDWASPIAQHAREIYPPFLTESAKLRGQPLPAWAKENGA
ncbi:hydrolase [Chryseobacterium lactis]|uniref:Hydrolase n=1 Tax=Chryseobacterium lactis TaxID=1241981 RepID=A0A3G6RIR3_CHRLC|nr:isochorismatase family protein [Chryseobacterium lactis]AZA84317.1 isochorismatase family protein [Chryseobacterium lactis]AZB04705.1 isochorismatase family protein [Chryseobacterium lactis]PNW14436.1 hydrolase [Chryseobacterium lactis]